LREISKNAAEKDFHLFKIKDALQYILEGGRYGQGSTYYKAPNPEYGAVFTYYLKETPKTLKAERKEKEKELFKSGKPIPQPSIDELLAEENEKAPYLIFSIKDADGYIIKKITQKASSGINRIAWDLRYESHMPVAVKDNKFDPSAKQNSGFLVMPGKYSVDVSLVYRGTEKALTGGAEFNVKALNNTTLPAASREEYVNYHRKAAELAGAIVGAGRLTDELITKFETIKQTINNTPLANFDLLNRAEKISSELLGIKFKFSGPPQKASAEETPPTTPSFNNRMSTLLYTQYRSTSNVTKNQKVAYEVLRQEVEPVLESLKKIKEIDLKTIEAELEKISAPWTPGRLPQVK
jgi:hypothetical protein